MSALKALWLVGSDDEGASISRNVRNYLLRDTASRFTDISLRVSYLLFLILGTNFFIRAANALVRPRLPHC